MNGHRLKCNYDRVVEVDGCEGKERLWVEGDMIGGKLKEHWD